MNSNLEGSILVSSDRKSIVEVLGCFRVDGEDPVLPEILSDLELSVGDGLKKREKSAVTRAGSDLLRGEGRRTQGRGGRHLMTLSVKSSVGKLEERDREKVSI